MKLQIGTTAYHFPTIESLIKFLRLNKGSIKYEQAMIDIRNSYGGSCFIFKEYLDGGYDWDAYTTIDFAKEVLGARIIIFGYQRTE